MSRAIIGHNLPFPITVNLTDVESLIGSNRPTTDIRRNAKRPFRAVSLDMVVTIYAFLRLAIPIKPRRPEPKSQTAAGTGTASTHNV